MSPMVHDKRGDVGQDKHVDKLEQGPGPGIGLTVYHCDGAHALHGKNIKYHQT